MKIVENWKYCEDFVNSTAIEIAIRNEAIKLNCFVPSKAVCNYIKTMANATRAKNIVEIGSTAGLPTVQIIKEQNSEQKTVTSIDNNPVNQTLLETSAKLLTIDTRLLRQINTSLASALEKMTSNAYDLVILNKVGEENLEQIDGILALLKAHGTAIITNAFLDNTLSDPSDRSNKVVAMRTLLKVLKTANNITSSLLPIGEGILVISKLN